MGFLIISLSFGVVALLLFLLTIYIYLRIAIAVRTERDLPRWIYVIGSILKGRFSHIQFDDVTDSIALKEATLSILNFILANIVVFGVVFYETHHFSKALYTCLKAEFGIAIVVIILSRVIKLITGLFNRSNKPIYYYSSSNAVLGTQSFACFFLVLFISLTGFPSEPIEVQVDKTNVIIGETKASELLSEGFTFYEKTADSEIVNQRNDHFYYGKLLEIFRDGKSYGFMSVTPTEKDSDSLKNCVITYYEIDANSKQLSEVTFNHTDLSHLTIQDFRTKDIKDIFSLNPVDSEEIKNDTLFSLTMQTADYELWKRYRIEANFNPDGTAYRYGARAQHAQWE
ncbi:hypothetical protein [Atopobium fossor]|uniref:hypothetical protein n=1 Tax=Atopobium fossor TaxID=39487 RepID=UPI00040EAD8C|nr:hypothetical protein [Atopobium fossor]